MEVTDVIQRALLGGDDENDDAGGESGKTAQAEAGQEAHQMENETTGLEVGPSSSFAEKTDADEPIAAPAVSGEPTAEKSADPGSNMVVIDVSHPIQLSHNSLIVVDGHKCVLQHDPSTGQVVAYPIKEPEKPKRRRGRPRKVVTEEPPVDVHTPEAPAPTAEEEEMEDEADELLNRLGKGMVEVVTEDGALVRRSCRRRKKAKSMNDYETNLKLNDESDETFEEEEEETEEEAVLEPLPRKRGRGRPPKKLQQNPDLFDPFWKSSGQPGKRKRGRPRRHPPKEQHKSPMQAFLVQMADGQTLMMQIPTASIPTGMDLHDVAQNIANSLNAAAEQQGSVVLQQQGFSADQTGQVLFAHQVASEAEGAHFCVVVHVSKQMQRCPCSWPPWTPSYPRSL